MTFVLKHTCLVFGNSGDLYTQRGVCFNDNPRGVKVVGVIKQQKITNVHLGGDVLRSLTVILRTQW